ncbi:MAG: metal ABC transporter ATP-binding protein, partial [Bacteroidota bacterium]
FAGDFLAIVGPNGSGKSTLLKAIAGIIPYRSGSIELIANSNEILKSQDVGYVPQIKKVDPSFPATGYELVASGISKKWPFLKNKSAEERITRILDRIDAVHLIIRQLSGLSGGELQRLYLARALVRQPKILLLDEPATGIDLVCEENITGLIESFHKEGDNIVIMVTHDWTSAYHHANKVMLLNKEMKFFGEPERAFTDENLGRTFSNYGLHHKVKLQLGEEN